MSTQDQVITWVVYLSTMHKKTEGMRAVCEQSEWDAMERAFPGQQTLIQDGITNEGEAERLARGTAGDPKARTPKKWQRASETAAV
jgi:hypothetical protein